MAIRIILNVDKAGHDKTPWSIQQAVPMVAPGGVFFPAGKRGSGMNNFYPPDPSVILADCRGTEAVTDLQQPLEEMDEVLA